MRPGWAIIGLPVNECSGESVPRYSIVFNLLTGLSFFVMDLMGAGLSEVVMVAVHSELKLISPVVPSPTCNCFRQMSTGELRFLLARSYDSCGMNPEKNTDEQQ